MCRVGLNLFEIGRGNLFKIPVRSHYALLCNQVAEIIAASQHKLMPPTPNKAYKGRGILLPLIL